MLIQLKVKVEQFASQIPYSKIYYKSDNTILNDLRITVSAANEAAYVHRRRGEDVFLIYTKERQ